MKKNNLKLIPTLVRDQGGISLILSLVIVTSLVGVVVAVANISLRVAKDSATIESSEIAFLAAETGMELALYEIEKNGLGVDLGELFNQPLDGISQGTAYWSREVKVATATPALCSSGKPVCTNNPGSITNSNPLLVTLPPDTSFQLDMNITGVDAGYPDHVRFISAGGASRTVFNSQDGQTEVMSNNVKIPPSGQLVPEQDYRVRIINESVNSEVFSIEPSDLAIDLPLGIKIEVKGYHGNVERRIEVIRPAWIIY